MSSSSSGRFKTNSGAPGFRRRQFQRLGSELRGLQAAVTGLTQRSACARSMPLTARRASVSSGDHRIDADSLSARAQEPKRATWRGASSCACRSRSPQLLAGCLGAWVPACTAQASSLSHSRRLATGGYSAQAAATPVLGAALPAACWLRVAVPLVHSAGTQHRRMHCGAVRRVPCAMRPLSSPRTRVIPRARRRVRAAAAATGTR